MGNRESLPTVLGARNLATFFDIPLAFLNPAWFFFRIFLPLSYSPFPPLQRKTCGNSSNRFMTHATSSPFSRIPITWLNSSELTSRQTPGKGKRTNIVLYQTSGIGPVPRTKGHPGFHHPILPCCSSLAVLEKVKEMVGPFTACQLCCTYLISKQLAIFI
jgi:hypothetical protein